MTTKTLVALLFGLTLTSVTAARKSRPNFVLILADDQGWNALSTRMDPDVPGSGSTYYHTPNLDGLAAHGMRFSHAYAPAPTCSPTRHALQFGRSPASLKVFGADGIRDWDAPNHESLANTLKRIDPDYVCAHLGKWHIGRSPEALGYDVSDGSTGNRAGNSDDPDDPKRIFDLSRRSNQFIRKQVESGKPFFLQISHYANHLRFEAKPETIKKYETEHADKATQYQNSPLWAAMNENLDAGVGMVLDQIDELGIADSTYVFYTADNGYELKRDLGKPIHQRGYYKAFPQRSHKYTVSEGGIRVPFIVRGPGIPAGTHSPAPVVGTDIFATVMYIAGGTDQIPARVEGVSLTAHMKSGGKEAIDREDDFLVFKHSKPRAPHDITIVQGQYKLIKDISTGKVFLFDLKEDISERNNLAAEQPERTAEMYAAMTTYFKRFGWDESKVEAAPSRKRKPKPTGPAKLAPPQPSEGRTIDNARTNKSDAAAKPNVVIIFIDDMGYGDIGPFGGWRDTPHLDRMAKEGMKLTDFYVSSAACTPSRAALMTGCYADRIGMGASVVFPADRRGLHPNEITIAEMLKGGGYATGCFGKWHLGDQPEFLPTRQGFDQYEGIPYSNDMWVRGNPKRHYPPLPWMKQDRPVAHIPDQASQAVITNAITGAAVDFIRRHKDGLFFAYVPHSAVHYPFMVTPERLAAGGGDVMTALISEVDNSTGRILRTLRELGIAENTFVLFTNDNGGGGKTSPGPLRGAKFGPKYEGHMRVATLAWWPGRIPAGSVSSDIMTTTDLLPTVARLTGQPVPADRIIDGKDVSSILLGKPDAKSPHETLYYENGGIRQGKWKLVHYRVKADWFTELYDLEADLGEQNNIADRHPDRIRAMKAALDAHVDEIEKNVRPAAFVENPKPLLSDASGLPTLAEYIGQASGSGTCQECRHGTEEGRKSSRLSLHPSDEPRSPRIPPIESPSLP